MATLLLGYGTKAFSDWIQHRRTSEREREARREARLEKSAERRITFQRQTLLDLQEAMMQLLRSSGATHVQDVAGFRKDGKWQKRPLTEELNESSRLANARTSMLIVRVRDDSVRDLAQVVKNHATSVDYCSSEDESFKELKAMSSAFDKLNHRIGEILRTLDDAEQ